MTVKYLDMLFLSFVSKTRKNMVCMTSDGLESPSRVFVVERQRERQK